MRGSPLPYLIDSGCMVTHFLSVFILAVLAAIHIIEMVKTLTKVLEMTTASLCIQVIGVEWPTSKVPGLHIINALLIM